MLYTLRKCKLCRYMTVINKILPRYVRTHEWQYWFRLRDHLSQRPASNMTMRGWPGESRKRTSISNSFPKHYPRFSFQLRRFPNSMCLFKTSQWSSYKVHVHLNPCTCFASVTSFSKEFHRLTICVQILCQMFLSVTCILFVGWNDFCGLWFSSFSTMIKERWLQLLGE